MAHGKFALDWERNVDYTQGSVEWFMHSLAYNFNVCIFQTHEPYLGDEPFMMACIARI